MVDEVRFSGEPVALVLAGTQAEDLDAAELVELELEPRKPVLSVAEATMPGAWSVHDVPFPGPVNTVVNATLSTAGFQDIFDAAAARVTICVSCARQSALPIETRGSLAAFDRRTGRVTLTTSTQTPHVTRTGICARSTSAQPRVAGSPSENAVRNGPSKRASASMVRRFRRAHSLAVVRPMSNGS